MFLPEVGTTCKYTFTNEFESLNGIYTLTLKETYETAIANGVDFVKSLYTLANLTETDYQNDWKNYQNKTILQLESINDPSVIIYAPEPIVALVPDPTIRQYNDIYIGVVLGIFGQEDSDKISWILGQLNNLAQSITGTTNSSHIFSSNKVWMAEADYAAIQAGRAANIKSVETDYSALQAQIAINGLLKNQIAYYEYALKQLAVNNVGPNKPVQPTTPS